MADVKIVSLDLEDEVSVRFIFETRSHPSVSRNLLGKPPENFQSHINWLKTNVPRYRQMYVMQDGNVRVGYCHVYHFDEIAQSAEAGFVGHPEYQGRGYGERMVGLLLCVLSQIMYGWSVYLKVRENNIIAQKIYAKHGFFAKSVDEGLVTMERICDIF